MTFALCQRKAGLRQPSESPVMPRGVRVALGKVSNLFLEVSGCEKQNRIC